MIKDLLSGTFLILAVGILAYILLFILDLNRIANDEGRNISSGEQRRIEIARSLLHSAQVLIFDEVVSTPDIETAYEIEKIALDFSDKSVVFISDNFSGKTYLRI